MLGLFSRANFFLDEDQEVWVIEQYNWLLENIGFPIDTVPLITPTQTYFSDLPERGHERAEAIFIRVKELMGMQEWNCNLVAQEEDINPHVGETLIVQNIPNSPLGTFSVQENDVTISYNPHQLYDNQSLISTFAHELSHYVLAASDKPRLGNEDDEEFLTDMFAIASGFGLFMVNSKSDFKQFSGPHSQGWQSSSTGYLTEHEMIFTLMLFMQRYGHDIKLTELYLKKHLYKILGKAYVYSSRKKISLDDTTYSKTL